MMIGTDIFPGGVQFEPPNGTMGLPYWALEHFSKQVESSGFEEEYRSYCLPVLDPNIISCKEEPFDQQLGRTNSSLVEWLPLKDNQLEMYKVNTQHQTMLETTRRHKSRYET